MSYFISICSNMKALKASGAVDLDSPYRALIDGRSGAHIHYNADKSKSMVGLTSLDGLESLGTLPFISVAPVEDFFTHKVQAVIDGIPQVSDPTITTTPAYTQQVVVGYEDDLAKPIYLVVRHEDGTYETTETIEGYRSKPIYGDGDLVEEQTISTPNPVMVTVKANPKLRALYNKIYPRLKSTDEDGNTSVPALVFYAPSGQDINGFS